jgi:hypothetical protein
MVNPVAMNERFGTDDAIQAFARRLIISNNKPGLRELAKGVSTMGSSVKPNALIERVKQKIGYKEPASKAEPVESIAYRLKDMRYLDDAEALIEAMGGECLTIQTRCLVYFRGYARLFETHYEMTQWLITEVATPHHASQQRKP